MRHNLEWASLIIFNMGQKVFVASSESTSGTRAAAHHAISVPGELATLFSHSAMQQHNHLMHLVQCGGSLVTQY